MIEKPAPAERRIIDCLETDYGIKAARVALLPLGADLNASVYKVEACDQSSYFVKVKLGYHSDISIIILELLHSVGIQQLILPIKTKNGQSAQRLDCYTMTVFPFIEGQDGFSRDLTDDQWITLGKVMRQIHEISVPQSIQTMIRRETYSSQWREIVRSLYAHIESRPDGDEIALKLMSFMNKHAESIHRLVDGAEQLSQKIQSQQSEFVLCHSDIHGGNVLINRDDVFYIVDWDDPIMAPKERDLMFIGGGVANVWNKAHEQKLFYQGYGKTNINMTMLAYYRHERIVEDIAILGQQLLLTSSGCEFQSKRTLFPV